MKLLKYLLTGLLVAGVAASASASSVARSKITRTAPKATLAPAIVSGTTFIHIVGSTAYRSPVSYAIEATFVPGSEVACFWGSSTFGKANGMIMSGTYVSTSGSVPVVVETFWTGSAAGLVDLVKQNAIQDFMDYSTYITSGTATSGNGRFISGVPTFATGSNGTSSPAAPDAAMSDSDYQSVAYVMSDATITQNGTNVKGGGAALQQAVNSGYNVSYFDAGTSAGAVGPGVVGIVPVQWVLGNPGTVGLTASNISQQVAHELIYNGAINFSQLSGSSADVNNFALMVGRNEDSGTRIDSCAEAQAGFGVSPNQVLFSFNNNNTTTSVFPLPVYGVQTGGTGSTIASITSWPVGAPLNTEPSISWTASAGHSGYVSGGDVANTLLAQNNGGYTVDPSVAPGSLDYTGSSKIAFIGYVGVADAAGALSGNSGGNAIALNYNGVPFSVSNVQNGTYTLWGYEHMYTNASASSVTRQFINAVADQVFNTTAAYNSSGVVSTTNPAGILYGTMNFTRSTTEGGVVNPKQ